MIKVKHQVYNDGLLEFGDIKSVYNAKREKTGETFESIGSLYFEVMSARESDYMLASQLGYNIDLKVRTPKRLNIDRSHKVKLRGSNDLYEIRYLDFNDTDNFIHLQRAGAKNG